MKKDNGAIGILGGMGPEASAQLVNILVEMSAKEFGAKNGDEFPEIILDSIPIPDFISNKKNMPVAFRMLERRIKMMEKMNIKVFAIACNTAHIMLNKLRLVSKKPFVSLVDEVVRQLMNQGFGKVGILATPVTINSRLFQEPLNQANIELITPSKNQFRTLDAIIRKVIAGEISRLDKLRLIGIAKSLKKKGAQGIILGCTELPLVFPKDFIIPTFDSLEILARALLRRHFGESTN